MPFFVPCDQAQLPLTLTPLSPTPAGARLVESAMSRLVVGAAPVDELRLLLEHPVFAGRPAAYLLLGEGALRVGETLDLVGRMAAHMGDPPLAADSAIIITCLHADFGRDAVTALQSALHHQAIRAGRARVVGAPPHRSWLQVSRPVLVARWLDELRPMLVAAGCSLLEPPGARLQPRVRIEPGPQPLGEVDAADPELPLQRGYITAIPEWVYADATAQRYALGYRGVRAEAVAVDGLCVVLAGSVMAAKDASGIQDCLSRKRMRLVEEGLARPTVRRDVVRIACDLGVPSLTNAARMLTGTNLPGRDLWVRVA